MLHAPCGEPIDIYRIGQVGTGKGSLRERSPRVWEIRVVTGFDAGRGRSIQRSFTVHGDVGLAEQARRELVAEYGTTCAGSRHEGPRPAQGII